jgi:hypothetical protein
MSETRVQLSFRELIDWPMKLARQAMLPVVVAVPWQVLAESKLTVTLTSFGVKVQDADG